MGRCGGRRVKPGYLLPSSLPVGTSAAFLLDDLLGQVSGVCLGICVLVAVPCLCLKPDRSGSHFLANSLIPNWILCSESSLRYNFVKDLFMSVSSNHPAFGYPPFPARLWLVLGFRRYVGPWQGAFR